MARTATGVGPVHTAQLICLARPEIAGRLEAWRVMRQKARGATLTKSEQLREVIEAGLAALEDQWEAEVGKRPSALKIRQAAAGTPRNDVTSRARRGEAGDGGTVAKAS